MIAEIKNNKLYYQWRGKRKWRKLYRVGGGINTTSQYFSVICLERSGV